MIRWSATALGTLVCGLRADDSSVECWGTSPAAMIPPKGPFIAVSAGYDYACALDSSGRTTCWGSDYTAQPL